VSVARTLSYVDAVRLLGGDDEALLNRLDSLASGVMVALIPAAPGVAALLDAKIEVARLGHDLIRHFRERRAGLGRYDRTQRLAAAHTVLVVVAYFEAMAEADLPVAFAELELTPAEQLSMTGPGGSTDASSIVDQLLAAGGTLPAPYGAHERYRADLADYYGRLSGQIERFLPALAVWDRLSATDQDRYVLQLRTLPTPAVRRYGEHLRSLAADFPEVRVWLSLLEHEATREAVRALEPSLGFLERELQQLSSGRIPAERADSIGRAHRAELSRPIVPSGEVPPNISVPTLEQAYLPPRYRITDVNPQSGPSDEGWWEHLEIREDLEEFLFGYVTSVRATQAPTLVLGQPGAGKSVLTRVLAARLPPADFLAVHVSLRDVAAEFDIQRQIEEAIVRATGDEIAWPALVRSNPDALPVIILDGFDELLQATGVRQTDYLIRVAEFQRRESDQNRPAAIIVTTRTSVADRARTPADTLLLRLEPFDPPRIKAWIDVWNATNMTNFERTNTRPLALDTVMAHADIAGQPLLLLMLALYDADGNALQHLDADLRRTELYEELLGSFARREITRHRTDMTDTELAAAVEHEMRRLSIVAFAMFNRASQWVTETELEQDLTAIFGAASTTSTGFRTPMHDAELMLGRFFFVHRSRARRDAATVRSYEFLHATFGEYLVARLTWQAALDTMARDRAATLPGGGIDDELMYALLSFAALTGRRPIVDFVAAMSGKLASEPGRHLSDLLIRLYRIAGLPRSGRAFEAYRPRPLTVSARHAAYSANLLLLIVAVRGPITVSRVYGPIEGDVVDAWRNDTMLWQSQLSYDFHGLMEAVALERIWDGDRRDLRLTLDDGTAIPGDIDPLWTYSIAADRHGSLAWNYSNRLVVQRRVNFLCRSHLDQMFFALVPLLDALGPNALSRFQSIFKDRPDIAVSAGRAALDVWLLATDDDPHVDRDGIYLRCAQLCTHDYRSWQNDETEPHRLMTLLLRALASDPHVTPDTAAAVLEHIVQTSAWSMAPVTNEIVACAHTFLERDDPLGAAHNRVIEVLATLEMTTVDSDAQRGGR
jgi:hypothetical protein